MSLVNNDGEFTFARALVNPDKLVRDQTLLSVQNYVKNTKRMEELEMLKLWKALYFCMWLSDKPEIQTELASSLSKLVDLFPTKFLSLLFIKMFFRTILREWSLLDQYRVNKFYTLIRVITNKSFSLALSNGWNSTFSVELIQILEIEALTKRPNGIRFHIADIFLPELCKVTEGKIDSDVFVGLIQMFVRALLRADDSTFLERITDAVFNKFIFEYAGQNGSTDGLDHPQFSNTITLAVQKYIFDTAADEETPGPARKRLYMLHKSFATKSGHAFVDDDIISESLTTSVVQTKKIVLKESKTDAPVVAKVEKRKKSKVIEETIESNVQVSDEVTVPKKKNKREKAEEIESKIDEKVVVEPLKSALKKDSSKKIEAEITETVEKKRKKSSSKETIEVLPPASDADAPFVSSAKFIGSKLGYVFHKGASGVGYYLDLKVSKKVQLPNKPLSTGSSKSKIGGVRK